MVKKSKRLDKKEPLFSYINRRGGRYYIKGKDLEVVGLGKEATLHVIMYPDDDIVVLGRSIDDIKKVMKK